MPRTPSFPDLINKSGIYGICHMGTGKIYIGKSKNIGRRFTQYKYDYKNARSRQLNEYLLNAMLKYGIGEFSFSLLEEVGVDDMADRELFWINKFKSYDRDYGYNLRLDSSSNSTVVQSTRDKLSHCRKREWADGRRSGHSDKLRENWKYRDRKAQSELLSKTLTKYNYVITDNETSYIVTYRELKQLKLHSILSRFSRHNTNEGVLKGLHIRRVLING